MKYVIRYMLDGDGSVPKFVEDGGYFPVGEELVGLSIDSSKRFLPSTVKTVTRQELIDRAVIPEGSNKTKEEIVTDWLNNKNMGDLL